MRVTKVLHQREVPYSSCISLKPKNPYTSATAAKLREITEEKGCCPGGKGVCGMRYAGRLPPGVRRARVAPSPVIGRAPHDDAQDAAVSQRSRSACATASAAATATARRRARARIALANAI